LVILAIQEICCIRRGNMRRHGWLLLVMLLFVATPAFAQSQTGTHPNPGDKDKLEDVVDRAEDRADRRENRRDRAENRRDRREDHRDARHEGGRRDRAEDVIDRRRSSPAGRAIPLLRLGCRSLQALGHCAIRRKVVEARTRHTLHAPSITPLVDFVCHSALSPLVSHTGAPPWTRMSVSVRSAIGPR
jgi:hypothetical protein